MAQNWARRREDEIERGLCHSASAAEQTTLEQVIQRYATEITPRKAGAFYQCSMCGSV